jgi:hypothetical protein
MLAESRQLKLAKLKSDLLLKMKEYYQSIKEGKCFEEAKTIFLELKKIEEEYKKLMDEQLQ